jgi:hypothetical protein
VKEGVSIDALRLLADLVSPSVVRVILDHYLAKKDGKVVSFTIDLERLHSIARVYVKAPEAEIQALQRYCIKLRKHRRSGLTAKNMAVIRKFKDPENRARLKSLPGKLFDEAVKEQDAPIQAAVKAGIALAIQILLARFLRHVRPYWDAYRRRLPRQLHDRIQSEFSTGSAVLLRGRVLDVARGADRFSLTVQKRGSDLVLPDDRVTRSGH